MPAIFFSSLAERRVFRCRFHRNVALQPAKRNTPHARSLLMMVGAV